MPWCPECGREYPEGIVACASCRAVLGAEPPAREEGAPEVAYRVPDLASGALLVGLLEHHGLHAVLRSTMLPGYPAVRRDWGTTSWGEILVPPSEAEEARAIIGEYLSALEGGGMVRDEDVEGAEPS